MNGKYGYLMGAAVAAAMTFGAAQADAAHITGEFTMDDVGGFTHNGTSLGNATAIDFAPSGGGTGNFTVQSSGIFGDFATLLSGGESGTIKDLTFNLFTGPIASFWTIDLGAVDITFDLESLTIDGQGTTAAGGFLVLSGAGTLEVTGYDPTPGTWIFTANEGRASVTWQATSIAEDVPAPAAMGLLGLGLIGLGAAARRRNA